ncbi:MAG: rRNA adenine N-6-methyltransferase family protein [Candidatus Acidiferrum sp.]
MLCLEECRLFYSEEIRLSGNIKSASVIQAFTQVPREEFLGPAPWEIASPDLARMSLQSNPQVSYIQLEDPRQLYHNLLIVLDKNAGINNGLPSALACWIDALDLHPGDCVYHLGCGVGYYTAILAEIVGAGGSVIATEIQPELAVRSRQNLSRYSNVSVAQGDGAIYDPGPCDAIFINAGTTHPLPLWLNRLRDGGRLVLPLTMALSPKAGAGVMAKIVRQGDRFAASAVTSVAIYSCTSARDPKFEPLLKAAMMKGSLLKIKSLRRDSHEPSDNCVVHGPDLCLSTEALP